MSDGRDDTFSQKVYTSQHSALPWKGKHSLLRKWLPMASHIFSKGVHFSTFRATVEAIFSKGNVSLSQKRNILYGKPFLRISDRLKNQTITRISIFCATLDDIFSKGNVEGKYYYMANHF